MNIDLHKGDCLEIMPDLPPVEMILVDLPYGTTQCKWDAIIPFEPMWNSIRYLLKKGSVAALTASQPFSSALVMSNTAMFRHEWVWIKNRGSNFANTVREPMKEHEVVLIFSEGKWTYNKQMQPRTGGGISRAKHPIKFNSQQRDGTRQFEGRKHHDQKELRVPSTWQKFNTEVGLHPTQKPVPLMEYLVKTYSNEGDTVLDFCMGSGTTGVACKNLNRNFIGIEQDDAYFEVAKERIYSHCLPTVDAEREDS